MEQKIDDGERQVEQDDADERRLQKQEDGTLTPEDLDDVEDSDEDDSDEDDADDGDDNDEE